MYTKPGKRPAPPARVASQAAYIRLRGLILDGSLKPGERVLEERMAAELGISRTPVREAMARLQSEGFLASEGRRGLTVRQYTADDVRDIYDLRSVVEGHVAALAAEHATRADVRHIHEANGKMRAAIDRWDAASKGARALEEVRLLHQAVLSASRSEKAATLLRSLVEVPLVIKAASCYTHDQLWQSYEDHARIAAAIEGGESRRAQMLMTEHVLLARDAVLAALERRQAEAS